MNLLPTEPGSYALELFLDRTLHLQVGRAGAYNFPAGSYVYLGSAHGPGGLRSRLKRHLDPVQPRLLHWHIDYLRQHAAPAALVCLADLTPAQPAGRLECLWSQFFGRLPESHNLVPGFGASDCPSRCIAHLVHVHAELAGQLLARRDLRWEMAEIADADEARLTYWRLPPAVQWQPDRISTESWIEESN